MKITDTRIANTCHLFREVRVGTIFEWENNGCSEGFFMKIDDVVDKDEEFFNAINLYTGGLETFGPNNMVIEVNAELVVSYKE